MRSEFTLPTSIRRGGLEENKRLDRLTYLLMVLPALLLMAAVAAIPYAYMLYISLTRYNLVVPGSETFDGLTNYAKMVRDPDFLNSVWVQLQMSAGNVGLQVIFGVGIAVLLNARLRGVGVVRAVIVVPIVIPPVLVGLLWVILFTPTISPINYAMTRVGLPNVAWLADPKFALPSVIWAAVWEMTPFVIVIVLAALQTLPQDVFDAAEIDGASAAQTFRYLTLPMVRPAIFVAAVFRLIASLKAFPLIYIMTGGGPGTLTEALGYYAYRKAFTYQQYGYGAAVATMTVVLSIFLTFLVTRLGAREVEVE